ncbi:MAG: MBL fold metallo-hydrolase [Phycisphaerales bacterium]|nr:MBL fold metallo-hydrolase [Phycisphaerales bacterium]
MAQPIAEFEYDGIRILGYSQAGEETYFALPELNIGFDFGRAPRELLAVDHIFLSHGHMDHAAGMAYYFSQRMFIDNAPGTLYLPAGLEDPFRRLLGLWGEIDGNLPHANIVVAEPGRDIALRRDLTIRPFAVRHPFRKRDGGVIGALGYAAIETRQKLIDEYHGLPGPDLVKLKKAGTAITRPVEIPLVAYTGDTAPGEWQELDYVRKARVLLLECTFLDEDHIDRARAGYHLHIKDLRRIVPKLENERILLTHISRRTLMSEIRAILARELGEEYSSGRVSAFMDHRPKRRRRAPAQSDAREG